jgi:gas vesicle protein
MKTIGGMLIGAMIGGVAVYILTKGNRGKLPNKLLATSKDLTKEFKSKMKQQIKTLRIKEDLIENITEQKHNLKNLLLQENTDKK